MIDPPDTLEIRSSLARLLTTGSTLRWVGAYEVTDDPGGRRRRRPCLPVRQVLLAQGVSRERVATSVRMSLPLSVYLATAAPTMVGFARVVTDAVTHAWLDDVFVLPEHRRRGLAGALVDAALQHPAVAGTSMQLLLTADARALRAARVPAVPGPRGASWPGTRAADRPRKR